MIGSRGGLTMLARIGSHQDLDDLLFRKPAFSHHLDGLRAVARNALHEVTARQSA